MEEDFSVLYYDHARPKFNQDPSDVDTENYAFETDDVAGAMQRAIAAGATEKQAPRDEPWGQTTAYVIDPNGFLREMWEMMS